MIVKDETDNIEKCLEYALPLVDEAIIVDTGSTDGTREKIEEIQRNNPIGLIDAIWENDFSKARNISIQEATGQYILILDADERVFAKKEQLIEHLNKTTSEAYYIPIYNIYENREMTVSASMIRLYKNNHPKYKGAIHEQLYINGHEAIAQNINADIIKIYHYGYSKVIFDNKDKQKRNMDIIKKQIKEEPYEAFHRYNKGVMELLAKNYKSAMKDFVKSHELSNGKRLGFHNNMMINMIRCLIYQNKYNNVIEFVKPLLKDDFFGKLSDTYYLLGLAYRKKNKHNLAILNYQKAIQLGDQETEVSIYGSGSYLPLLEWARALMDQDMVSEAVEKYKEAIIHPKNYNKNGFEELKELAKKYQTHEISKKILETISSIENPIDLIDSNFQKEIKDKIKALINDNSLADAKLLIEEFINLQPNDAGIFSMKGVIAMLEGNYIDAIRILESGLNYDNTNDDLLYNLAYAYEISGNKEKALFYYKALLELPGQSQDMEIFQKVEELSK